MSDADAHEAFKNKVAQTLSDAGVEFEADVVVSKTGGLRKMTFKTQDEGAENALEELKFKLRKKIPPDLIEDLDNMDAADLRARIAQCECAIHESEQAKAADGELKGLQEKLKEARGPYADLKKLQTSIIKYAACILDQKDEL